jgi:hypothetical protein
VSIDVRAATTTLLVLLGAALLPPQSLAQGVHCASIRPGETAAGLAARLTGDARSRNEPWFQILDPATSRFVQKAQYGRIRPGWRACIVNGPVERNPRRSDLDVLGRAFAAIDSTFLLWAGLVILIAVAWSGVDEHNADTRRMLETMRRFGERFISEFERPLIQPDVPERPIQSRLRVSAHRRRVEVLLAPGGSRRYPNLSDHRTNVEYDVGRILKRLTDQPVVCSSLYAQGRWVVVPFTFPVISKQAGGA